MFTMIDKKRIEKLLNKLDDVQKQINDIHNELLIELGNDELSPAERAEIEKIRSENDFRTFDEWEKEKPLD